MNERIGIILQSHFILTTIDARLTFTVINLILVVNDEYTEKQWTWLFRLGSVDDREIVVEVQVNVLKELRVVHLELVEFGVVIFDPIVFQRLVHVEHSPVIFPSVTASMGVEGQVPLKDVVDSFLGTDLERDAKGHIFVVVGSLWRGCTK